MDPTLSQSNSLTSATVMPQADKHALAHSQSLQELIRAEIGSNDGNISFARFMEMALYEPGLGYYSAGARKIGEDGDFITAPEISSLFSICLGRQCAEIIEHFDVAVILELGAGTGLMASDLLTELEKLNCLPEKYLILETSADLRERQQQLIADRVPRLLSRVSWLDALPETPFKGLILANEVLDAMPVQRFRVQRDKIEELNVAYDGDNFIWHRVVADELLSQKVDRIIQQSVSGFSDGYSSELNKDLDAWIRSLSECLEQGVMLFIDYGYSRHEYYHEQRVDGTLLCHYQHRAHANPFINIGLQDITASVDFTAVAEAAVNANMLVSGYTTQAYFLIASGLEKILLEQKGLDEIQQIEFSRQVKLLTLPAEMGERFKVIALSRDMDSVLSGFSLIDHRQRL